MTPFFHFGQRKALHQPPSESLMQSTWLENPSVNYYRRIGSTQINKQLNTITFLVISFKLHQKNNHLQAKQATTNKKDLQNPNQATNFKALTHYL